MASGFWNRGPFRGRTLPFAHPWRQLRDVQGPTAPFPTDLTINGVDYAALIAFTGNDASTGGWPNRGTLGGTAAAIGSGGVFGVSAPFAGLEAVSLQGTRAFELAQAIDFGSDSIFYEAIIQTPAVQSINQWIAGTEVNPQIDLRLNNPFTPALTLIDSGGAVSAPSAAAIPADAWSRLFVLVSRQASTQARFFVDTTLSGQSSPSVSGTFDLTSPLRIGQRFATPNAQNFQGAVAWLAAWRVPDTFDIDGMAAVNAARNASFGPGLTSSDFSDDWA